MAALGPSAIESSLRFARPVHVSCPTRRGDSFGNAVLASNGHIYVAPQYSDRLLEVDPGTFEVTQLHIPQISGHRYLAGGAIAEASDGRLYISPNSLMNDDEIDFVMRRPRPMYLLTEYVVAFALQTHLSAAPAPPRWLRRHLRGLHLWPRRAQQ